MKTAAKSVVALVMSAVASISACGPTCEDVAADTRRELADVSLGCNADADCRAVSTPSVAGQQLCAEPCWLVVRADVDDATLRARFAPIAQDEAGCECARPRCGPITPVCEANRCVGAF
jgi:hypothetical protein